MRKKVRFTVQVIIYTIVGGKIFLIAEIIDYDYFKCICLILLQKQLLLEVPRNMIY